MFIPYKADVLIEKKPYIVIGLLIVCVLMFIYTQFLSDPELEEFFFFYGFIPLSPHFTSYISHIFLHANFLHITGNMLFLFLFGPALENYLGSFKFFCLYSGSGLAAMAGHIFFSNDMLQFEPCIGSSGAISGLLSAFLLCFPNIKIKHFYMYLSSTLGFISLPAWITISYWFVEQIFFHLLTKSGYAPIAFGAHIGGFLFGIIFYFTLIKKNPETPINQNDADVQRKHKKKLFNPDVINIDELNNGDFQKVYDLFLLEKKSAPSLTYFYFLANNNFIKYLKPADFFRIYKLLCEADKVIDAATTLTYFINNFSEDSNLSEAYFELGKLYLLKFNDVENGNYLLNIVITYFPDSAFCADAEALLC